MSVTRTNRTRGKVLAGAAVAALTATGVTLSGVGSASASTGANAPAFRAAAAHVAPAASSAHAKVVRANVGHGRMGAVTWKVDLEYYRQLPRGYQVPASPSGADQKFTGLLCERMYLNGIRIDHQGGPWSDCQPVTGPTQPLGDEGLWGLSAKGTAGYRLFVGQTSAPVGYAVLTFTDGRSYRADAAHLRGTGFASYAVPISKGRYISSVDTYTRDGLLLSHETYWH